MSWLDRALATVAPSVALRRAEARVRLSAAKGYEAGRPSERDAGWVTPSSGPNDAVADFITRVRDRARALVRDTPYAGRICDVQAGHQVGWGITPRVDTGSETLDKQVAALWEDFVAAADVTAVQDLNGLMHLAARSRAQDGEVLIRFVRPSAQRARRLGLPVPLQVELLEADWLDDLKDTGRGLALDRPTFRGVAMDPDGRRAGYWLLREHPGDRMSVLRTRESQFFPASDVVHLYRVLRPGQIRGISDLAPIIKRMHRLDAYEEAALEKARIEACLTAFVTSDAAPASSPLGTEATRAADGERVVQFGSGMVNYLRPGETVDTVAPTGAGGFEAFAVHQLMAIAVGCGLTYDQVTGDLRQANYSSLRAGKIEFKRMMQRDQWLMLIPRVCRPLWRAFIDAAIVAGRLPPGEYPVKWQPPPFEMIDPPKEIAALIAKLRAGLATPQEIIAEIGEDWREVIAEWAKWNKAADDAGLVFDIDARRVAKSGSAQDAAQIAAVEIAATGAAQPRTPQESQE